MSTSSSTDCDAVAYLGAGELARAYADGSLSPVQVASRLLHRVSALDRAVNSIVHVDERTTLAMARASEERHRQGKALSPLDGVPVTIKDLCAVAGWPLQRGSLALDPRRPSRVDTPCVARLREAGAVFLAKTATPEAGCKVVTRSAVHGVTANPYDLSKTPGGSSGGASAALALGFGPLAVGSDGAGSIRIPASFTNVFGLKPGFGRVPAFPADIDMPHSVVGPMARTVADAALMLDVICRPDRRDAFAWPVPFVLPADLADPDLRGCRVALSTRLGMHAPLVDAEVDRLTAEAVVHLANAGAVVDEASPAWPVQVLETFEIFWAAACMSQVDAFSPQDQPKLDPLILRVASRGRSISLDRFMTASRHRLELTAASGAFFNRFDLLVGPVMPIPAYSIDRDVPQGYDDSDWSWCPYTYIWNMTGQPAASVPVGFTARGLPVGAQIIAGKGREDLLLRACAAIEARRPFWMRRPDVVAGHSSKTQPGMHAVECALRKTPAPE